VVVGVEVGTQPVNRCTPLDLDLVEPCLRSVHSRVVSFQTPELPDFSCLLYEVLLQPLDLRVRLGGAHSFFPAFRAANAIADEANNRVSVAAASLYLAGGTTVGAMGQVIWTIAGLSVRSFCCGCSARLDQVPLLPYGCG